MSIIFLFISITSIMNARENPYESRYGLYLNYWLKKGYVSISSGSDRIAGGVCSMDEGTRKNTPNLCHHEKIIGDRMFFSSCSGTAHQPYAVRQYGTINPSAIFFAHPRGY